MPGTYKEKMDAAKKELAEKDAATKKEVQEMSPEEQRKALDEKKRAALKKKIKDESTSVQITTQG